MSLEQFSALTTVIQNIVVTAATVVGIYFGLRGLSAWRSEHIGKEKYESARRFLRSLYKLQNALNTAFYFLKSDKYPGEDIRNSFKPLEKDVVLAMNDYLAEALEAEITIGEPFTRLTSVNRLKLLPADLTTLLWEQVGYDVSSMKDDIKEIYSGRFDRELSSAVRDVEEKLRPYLGR